MRKPFQEMSEPEVREWMRETRNDLVEKKAREREILDARAKRNKHGNTDVILERDQILLQEVIYFLDHIKYELDVFAGEEEKAREESAELYKVRQEG